MSAARGQVRAPRERENLLDRPLTSYYLLLGSTAMLVALGLVMVLSASSVGSYATTGTSFAVFSKQLMWVCIGVPCLFIASRLPVRVWRWLAYPALLGTAVLLVAVLVIGREVDGAVRWIDVGPVSVQPSEPAKLALVLWGADLLIRKQRCLHEWKHLLIPLLPVASVFALLVMLEPDLGTTVCLLLVVVGLLWFVGAPLRLFIGFVALVVGVVTALAFSAPYRRERITAFLDPFADPLDSGYQGVHGLYAVASGGWWGVGLGASAQKWGDYLPNSHTDFVFAILGEELGLLGTLTLLLLFATFATAGFRIAARTRDPYARLVAGTVTVWVLGQAIVNVSTVLGLAPITGIPLPFVSFGGTALVVMMISVGMLAGFARQEPAAAAVLAARGPGRLAPLLARLPHRPPAHQRRPGPRSVPSQRRQRSGPRSVPPQRPRVRR